MIQSYKDKITEAVASSKTPKRFPADLVRSAQRKLTLLEYATRLDDLRSPPGNRLEALGGDRKGQHSLRITINGASASPGQKPDPRMSRSSTITDRK
jgi:proteic killer suppression protein